MSTQDSKFPAISFSLTEPLQNVRLLEVPEELLDIIVKTQQSLYFKSAAPTSYVKNGVEGKEGNLHLCTDEKVWAVKQVSTSNSIHVTKTCLLGQSNKDGSGTADDDEMELDDPDGQSNSSPGISAFAKPTSILELHPLHPATYETVVDEHLNTLVPTISTAEDITISRSLNNYSQRELYDHIPAPTSVIERVIAQKCVFEVPQLTGQPSNGNTTRYSTWIPSPTLLLSTWTELINAAILNGKDITNIENIENIDTLLEADEDSDTDTPSEHLTKSIHQALSTRLFNPTGHLASLGIITKTETSPAILNPRECTRWIGTLILATTTPNPTKAAFEKDWEDRVPTDWIKYCSVEVLQPSCEVTMIDGQEVVQWLPFTLEDDNSNKDGILKERKSQSVGFGAAPAAKNKRKWHEKFAAQRDAAKK